MSSSVHLILITCRNIFQTIYKIEDFFGQKYQDSSATVWVSKMDLDDIGVKSRERVKLRNRNDELVVLAEEDERIPLGICFMPMGPYANRLIGYDCSQGWPNYKFEEIICQPTNEQILSLAELKNQG